MAEVEEIDDGEVVALRRIDPELPHEPEQGHPEVVPHHHERLDPPAVAMTAVPAASSVSSSDAPGMEPLLELVDDEQNLVSSRDSPPCTDSQRVPEAESRREASGTCFRNPLSKRASVSSAVAST